MTYFSLFMFNAFKPTELESGTKCSTISDSFLALLFLDDWCIMIHEIVSYFLQSTQEILRIRKHWKYCFHPERCQTSHNSVFQRLHVQHLHSQCYASCRWDTDPVDGGLQPLAAEDRAMIHWTRGMSTEDEVKSDSLLEKLGLDKLESLLWKP